MLTWPGKCCGCNWLVTVKGCNGLALANATVAVSGGPSGTTNSSGQVTLTGVAPGASVTISKARFVSQTITVPAACANSTVTLSPTSSYVCYSGCADPLAQTLHLTDSVFGAVTLTWNGSNAWVGTITINYASCFIGCPAATGVPVTYTLPTSGPFTIACPKSASSSNLCPSPTGTSTSCTTSLGVTSCPPTLNISGTSPGSPGPACGCFEYLYCLSSCSGQVSYTITE